MKKVVSDTGALITLEKLDQGFDFIKKLYDQILVPPKVLEELTSHYPSPQDYLKHYQITRLIKVQIPPSEVIQGMEHLHSGEKEAIVLAKTQKLELLIEDNDGKEFAKGQNIPVSGIAGQILKAFQKKIIDKNEALEKLQEMFDKRRLNGGTYQDLSSSIQ